MFTLWTHDMPNSVAFSVGTPGVSFTTGGAKRRFPMGGSENGMPDENLVDKL